MGQIILNWLAILFLPLLLGAAMRAACRRFSKAWLITAAGALLSAVTWFTACHPPILGSELYGLRTIQAVSLTSGSLAAGLALRLKK